MEPSSRIARLVQALLFELLNEAGETQGEFGPAVLMTADEGYGITVHFPPRVGWGNNDTAGLKWAYNAAGQRRIMVLDGPAIETTVPNPPTDPTDRAGVVLSADTAGGVVERLVAHLYAGDAAGMIPATAIDGRAEVKVQRFGAPGAYTSIAELRVPGGAVTLTRVGTDVGVSVPDESDPTPVNTIVPNASSYGSYAPIYDSNWEDWDNGYAPLRLWRVGHMMFLSGLVRTTQSRVTVGGTYDVASFAGLPAYLRPHMAVIGVALSSVGTGDTAHRCTLTAAGQLSIVIPAALAADDYVTFQLHYPILLNI